MNKVRQGYDKERISLLPFLVRKYCLFISFLGKVRREAHPPHARDITQHIDVYTQPVDT